MDKMLYIVFFLIPSSVATFREHIGLYENQTSVYYSQLQQLCPYTTFCSLNASKSFEEKLPRGKTLCCKSCSCDSMCGLNRNCCFHEDDVYDLPNRDDIDCISPFTHPPPDGIKYFMVNKCIDRNKTCNDNKINTIMNPVYSPTTRLVYINELCASCNNVADGIPWKLLLSCNVYGYQPNTGSVSEEIYNIIKGKPNKCNIRFLPPDDVDLTHLSCNKMQIISSCNRKLTTVPLEMKRLCKSFNATFAMKNFIGFNRYYRNVFCALCNSATLDLINETTVCDESYDVTRASDGISFTGILTGGASKIFFNFDVKRTSSQRQVCRKSVDTFKDICKPLLCPEGQLRVDGKCDFAIPLLASSYIIVVKMTPVDRGRLVPVSFLQNLTIQERNSATWLRRGELSSWPPDIYYHASRSTNFVEYFLVILSYEQTSIELSDILNNVKTALSIEWTISTKNSSYNFSVRLNKYLMYYPYINNTYIPFRENIEPTESEEEIVTRLNNGRLNYFSKDGISMSLSYFCEQVELFPSEYVDKSDRIYINSKSKVLGTAEFRRMSPLHQCIGKVCNNMKVRVCANLWLGNTAGSLTSNPCIQQLVFFTFIQLFHKVSFT